MKIEALNKANEINCEIRDLKAHKAEFLKISDQGSKTPVFSLSLKSREGSMDITGINKKLIPASFANQYVANIDKEIKLLEKQIEKL